LPHDPAYLRGFEAGLRDLAPHLRNGELLPGGSLYRVEMDLAPDEDA
jgi:hypothetical protein